MDDAVAAPRDVPPGDWPHLPLAPTPGNPEPELIGPAEGRPTPATTSHLAGPEPELDSAGVVEFVRSYFREMHPTYHKEVGEEERDWDAFDMLMAEQDAIRDRYWRRTDTFFMGGVRSNDRRYDLTATRDWAARRIAPRLWQVNWVNAGSRHVSYEGLVAMVFDDGPRIVDEIYAKYDFG